ncbi:MAG: LysM peptidoglycan-binding domain-containing protein [Treponemataceae bacterium]
MKAFLRYFIHFTIIAFFSFQIFAFTHTVEQGETFYGISRKYGISVSELCSANNKTTKDTLKTGEKLVIPSNEKPDQYVVQQGDTLYSISKKFGVSVDTLIILNKMSGTDIKAGQLINVPMAAVNVDVNTEKNAKKESFGKNFAKNTEDLEDLKLSDSRTYDTKKIASKNLKWPVFVKEIQYVTGKVSGVAIVTNSNETVKAINDGKIVFCGVYRGFGNVVFVQNSSGFMYVYSNLAEISVKEGDKIGMNQKLGTVALDSLANKSQLLLMVFKNGNPVDPAKAPRG